MYALDYEWWEFENAWFLITIRANELHISFILSPADLGQALTLAEFYVQVYSPSCSLITAEPWPGPGRLLTQLLN